MSEITIKQARTEDIPIIENILLDTVNWLNDMEQPLWGVGEVLWGTCCIDRIYSTVVISEAGAKSLFF